MGFLSILGNLGKAALGIGGSLGAGAAASKGGRMADADLQARMDALNNRTALDAKQFNMGTGAARLGQVQRADFAANMKDAPMTGDPRIDKFAGGGLRPSTFGPDSRTAANEMKRQALSALMSGSDQFTPTVSAIPKAGMLEKIGGIAGLAHGIAGGTGLLDALGRPRLFGQDFNPTTDVEDPLAPRPKVGRG